MSISTRTGDDGTTSLIFGRRVSKTHVRVEACGTLDELNSALGVARAAATGHPWIAAQLLPIQKDLIPIMGELAVDAADVERLAYSSLARVEEGMLIRLDHLLAELESQDLPMDDWATPGNTPLAAALDLARSLSRRAERRILAIQESGQPIPLLIPSILNRLSDCLWLLARKAESAH